MTRTPTDDSLQRLLFVREQLMKALDAMDDLKIVDFADDWMLVAMDFHHCYRKMREFISTIDSVVSGGFEE